MAQKKMPGLIFLQNKKREGYNMSDISKDKKLNEYSKKAHQMAKAKGFYDNGDRNIGEQLMLVVTELSEAVEAHRTGKRALLDGYENWIDGTSYGEKEKEGFELYLKDTFEDEIADTFIRLFDLCGYMNIDIETFIDAKMKYNSTRGNKHGKQY